MLLSYYIILHYYIIIYYILSYTILFFSSDLFLQCSSSSHPLLSSPHPNIPFSSSLFPLILSLLPIFSSSFLPLLFHPNHSKYTCRYLHILIYITITSFQYPTILTPHVLSEGNVEWCSFNVCVLVCVSCWCLCFVLVLGSGLCFMLVLTLGVILYLILYSSPLLIYLPFIPNHS